MRMWAKTEAGHYVSSPDADGTFYRVCRYENWWYCEMWKRYASGTVERKDVFDKCRTLTEAKRLIG